jgi:CBS domain containing-hemolysin-like protein
MELLIFYLLLALGVSFLCSILESVILSVTPSFVAAMKKRNPSLGEHLNDLKKEIDRPLAAILTLNTVAHTVGAAGVGAQAMIVFGDAYISIISAILTLLILIFSEIIPKTLGALYWRNFIKLSIHTLRVLIFLLYPFVALSQKITRFFSRGRKVVKVSREEIGAIVDIGYEEGSILKKESVIFKNLMRFGTLSAKDIMTPRPVIFSLPDNITVNEVLSLHSKLLFSRIPIFYENFENINHYVLKSDILLSASKQKVNVQLKEFQRKLLIVPEILSLFNLFEQLLEKREHMALIIDEYGGVAGLVTLEDIVETLIGIEIVDETDVTTDLQKLARSQWEKRARKLGLLPDKKRS